MPLVYVMQLLEDFVLLQADTYQADPCPTPADNINVSGCRNAIALCTHPNNMAHISNK